MPRIRSRWQHRILGLLAIAILGVLLYSDHPAFEVLGSFILVLLPALDWSVWVALHRASSLDPTIESLRDRADDALDLAVAATLGAAVGVHRLLYGNVDPVILELAILIALIVVSAPAIEWLRLYRLGAFWRQ